MTHKALLSDLRALRPRATRGAASVATVRALRREYRVFSTTAICLVDIDTQVDVRINFVC